MNNEMQFEEEQEFGEVIGVNTGSPKQLKEASIDINPVTGERVELNALEKIKFASEKFGIKLNDVDKDCKKCYGRGYTGIESKTGVPVPCKCIIPKAMREAAENQFIPQNRKTRRTIEKMSKKR